ncbi:MAG: antibiotic biosynthesis monooxygenase [Actinomycetota bacterium]|nr:antibiotic biosynthesis monooxygenase [Actinomycetota bacterium]
MIVVIGRVVTDAAKREQLVRIAHAVASTSREEEGCRSYRIYEDTEISNEFVFVEEWEDQAALERHFGTPHVAEFMQAIPETVVATPDVRFHTIASTVDLAEVQRR